MTIRSTRRPRPIPRVRLYPRDDETQPEPLLRNPALPCVACATTTGNRMICDFTRIPLCPPCAGAMILGTAGQALAEA